MSQSGTRITIDQEASVCGLGSLTQGSYRIVIIFTYFTDCAKSKPDRYLHDLSGTGMTTEWRQVVEGPMHEPHKSWSHPTEARAESHQAA